MICSERLVESNVIEAKQGMLIPLVNWTRRPVKGLQLTIAAKLPSTTITLASGNPLQVRREAGAIVLTLDLDVADAVILR